MKLALFSDVHANLPALEAVLADLDKKSPDAVYCLGDLVGYNIWPNEVINSLRSRGIPTIAGNYDFAIGRYHHDCGCDYREEEARARGSISVAYTNAVVGDAERRYLRTLPTQLRLTFELDNDPAPFWQQQLPLSLLMVHGSPRRINEFLFEDRGECSLGLVLERASADILCFGHTHKPFYQMLNTAPEGHPPYWRHAINTGSVGRPREGDPRACYVLLTIGETARRGSREGIGVEFVRVPYDVERAARAIEQSALPHAYANQLRMAR